MSFLLLKYSSIILTYHAIYHILFLFTHHSYISYILLYIPNIPDILDIPNIPYITDIPYIPDIPDILDIPNIPDIQNIPNILYIT